MKLLQSKLALAAVAVFICGLVVTAAFRGAALPVRAAQASSSTSQHANINCGAGATVCTEVWDSEAVFGEGKYIGHDEPSTLFYSNVPGSGNQMRYTLTLPKDPSPANPLQRGKSFDFELNSTFWFGMAMCDTQSYPELLSTCTPDSDKNIVDPAISPRHPGTAFTELQFYPPGWVQGEGMGFEGDQPRIENPAVCDRFTGVGCTLIPTTDDPARGGSGFQPAAFYPFFSSRASNGQCDWRIGNHIPGSTNDFHQNQQYGTLLNITYTGLGGQPTTRYNDFRQILAHNPCPAATS